MIRANNDIGKQFGNYRLEKYLGRGSFGNVYVGQHIHRTNAICAIKIMTSTHLDSMEEQASFLHEAHLLEVLRHPYILPIMEADIHDGLPYLAAEYAPGGSLRERLQRQGRVSMEKALAILSQIGQALHFAHQHQVIHRDLKPGNILFNTKDEALLGDFGIAVTLATDSIKFVAEATGSPPYMAPEQFQGTVSKKSDQYSLGCIAYELFTGHRPFTAPDPITMGSKHLMENPIPLRQFNPALPEPIERAVLKAMAKRPDERHDDVLAFVTALHSTPISQAAEIIPSVNSTPREETSTAVDDDDTQRKLPLLPQAQPTSGMQPPVASMFGASPPFPAVAKPKSRRTKPNRRRRGLPIAAAILIVLLLLLPGGGYAFYLYYAAIHPAAATVSITPKSTRLQNTFPISIVTGNPDATQHQVAGARLLSSTRSQTHQATATKQVSYGDTSASGTLTFTNSSEKKYFIYVGYSVTGSSGVTVVVSQAAAVYAGQTVTVGAYASVTGTGGNIPAYDVNVYCCGDDTEYISIQNTSAFYGGQNAGRYTAVQQSDIDGVANPLKAQLTQQSQADVQKQIPPNEQLVAPIQCSPAINSDKKVGDRADTFNVNVSVKCIAEVYDPASAQSMAGDLLKSQATADLGPNYALVASVLTSARPAVLVDANSGTLSIGVDTSGIWVYEFSKAEKHHIAQLTAGKTPQAAQTQLLTLAGISKATVSLSGGGFQTPTSVPTDLSNITINVTNVPGLHATPGH